MNPTTRKRLALTTLVLGAIAAPVSATPPYDHVIPGPAVTPADRQVTHTAPAIAGTPDQADRLTAAPASRFPGVAPVAPARVAQTAATSSSGFDWADAGIGFGAAAGLVLLGGGTVAVTRRTRKPAF